jgi:hypothetical protein
MAQRASLRDQPLSGWRNGGRIGPSTSTGTGPEQPESVQAPGSVTQSASGPGLSCARDRTAPLEPSRSNHHRMRSFPRPNPILPSGAAAARAGSKSSLKGRPDTRQAEPECADLCPPTYEASSKRWTERAETSGNSHCTPTASQKTTARSGRALHGSSSSARWV